MTSEPKAPGAPAIILFREVDRDDRGQTAHEDVYLRIKILTEEGRKYADIEIPFFKEEGNIVNLHARTIKPDGTIVEFSGKAFDKTIVKARGVKYMAKTFTSARRSGRLRSRVLLHHRPGRAGPLQLPLDSERRVLHPQRQVFAEARLSVITQRFNVRWTWNRLPAGTAPPAEAPNHVINLEAKNIPAFRPKTTCPRLETEIACRFHLQRRAFSRKTRTPTGKNWERNATSNWKVSLASKHKAMEEAVCSNCLCRATRPEVKLQKIYARVQQIRNTSYEAEKTDQEQKRNKEKIRQTSRPSGRSNTATALELTWLFPGPHSRCRIRGLGIWVPDRQQLLSSLPNHGGARLDANLSW